MKSREIIERVSGMNIHPTGKYVVNSSNIETLWQTQTFSMSPKGTCIGLTKPWHSRVVDEVDLGI